MSYSDDLYELCSVSFVPQKAMEAGRMPEPVVATAFDVSQELLWTGTEGGWVGGFQAPLMERYMSVHAHTTRVLGLKPLQDLGLLSLSESTIKLHSHGGFQHYAVEDETGDLTCMEPDFHGNQVILGRSSNKLSCMDLQRGKITGDMDTNAGTVTMCARGATMACGNTDGTLVLRDFRAGLHAMHTLPAHAGPVVCVDAHRDLMVSCGMTMRHGQVGYDSIIKVFDIRVAARALTHVPFHSGCAALQFHPKFSGMVLFMSNSGHLLMTDVNTGGASLGKPYQVDCEGDYLLSCNISSTGEALAFGDGGGYVHLWSYFDEPQVNEFSQATDLPEEPKLPGMIDSNVPLSALPVYFGHDLPLSQLPPNQLLLVGLPPHKIDTSLLQNIKQVDFVGYVPNPEYQRGAPLGEATRKVAPLRNARVRGRHDRALDAEMVKERMRAESILPRGYHSVVVQKDLSKKVFEDFDFASYNQTNFAGLENGMRNCYVNSLLQVLYFIPWLRAAVLGHICESEFCLTCELSFLFHMLRIGAKSTVCQAANLLRTLKQIREAAALGLLEDPALDSFKGNQMGKHNARLGARIQSFCRFVLEQTMKEMAAQNRRLEPAQTAPAALFGSTVRTTTRCMSPSATHGAAQRESRNLFFELHYPAVRSPAADRPSFAQLLQQSLSQTTENRAWCDTCRAYQPLHQTKQLCSCADLLLINTNLTQASELYWWGVSPELLGMGVGGAPGASPPSSPHKAGVTRPTPPASPLKPGSGVSGGNGGEEPWLPAVLGLEVDPNGGARVVQGADCQSVQVQLRGGPHSAVYELCHVISHIKEGQLEAEEEAGMNPTEVRKKRRERDEGHLVAHVRPHPIYYDQHNVATPPKGTPGISPLPYGKFRPAAPASPMPSPPSVGPSDIATPTTPASNLAAPKADEWLLFNDFCVTPTTGEEARTLYGKHKLPCLLFYQKVDLPFPPPLPASQITESMYHRLTPEPRALNLPAPHTFVPLDLRTEAPAPGALMAIDCEFVSYAPAEKEIHEDGSEVELRAAVLGLGRVSVVRGDDGSRSGSCLIDDYVRTVEPVYDYLTRFSGLVHGDLDPGSSKHHLTSLKHAYLKLRYLADMGCKFVGHGLKKDFRMANIVIPPAQIIDTVEIYHFKRQRKLSLRFLASYLLGMDIQANTHNSIEDAVVALRLYKKYLELEKAGTFQDTLLEIYRYGKKHNWEVQHS